MMDFISVPLITGIVFTAIYRLFELFVRRKERLTLIEKLGDKLDTSALEGKFLLPTYGKGRSFTSLKAGCLLMGVGLGLLIGFFINASLATTATDLYNQNNGYTIMSHEFFGIAYGASVLLFGGIGLLVAFIVEMKLSKKQ